MIPWGEFDILAIYLEYLVTRFQFIDTRTSTGYKSEKKANKIIQTWKAEKLNTDIDLSSCQMIQISMCFLNANCLFISLENCETTEYK